MSSWWCVAGAISAVIFASAFFCGGESRKFTRGFYYNAPRFAEMEEAHAACIETQPMRCCADFFQWKDGSCSGPAPLKIAHIPPEWPTMEEMGFPEGLEGKHHFEHKRRLLTNGTGASEECRCDTYCACMHERLAYKPEHFAYKCFPDPDNSGGFLMQKHEDCTDAATCAAASCRAVHGPHAAGIGEYLVCQLDQSGSPADCVCPATSAREDCGIGLVTCNGASPADCAEGQHLYIKGCRWNSASYSHMHHCGEHGTAGVGAGPGGEGPAFLAKWDNANCEGAPASNTAHTTCVPEEGAFNAGATIWSSAGGYKADTLSPTGPNVDVEENGREDDLPSKGYFCCDWYKEESESRSEGPSFQTETACDAHCGPKEGKCYQKHCLCSPEGPGADDDWARVEGGGVPFSYANEDLTYHGYDYGRCRPPNDEFYWEGGNGAFCVMSVLHTVGCIAVILCNWRAVSNATALAKHFVAFESGRNRGGQNIEMVVARGHVVDGDMPTAVPLVVPTLAIAQPVASGGADWLMGWLANLDGGAGTFTRYAPAFRVSGFDSVPALAALTDADLVQMGVLTGHRRVILARVSGGGRPGQRSGGGDGGGGGGGKVAPQPPQAPREAPPQQQPRGGAMVIPLAQGAPIHVPQDQEKGRVVLL